MGRVFAGIAAVLVGLAFASDAGSGNGRGGKADAVRVIDGDTLEVHGQVINLFGIDAPELGQQCVHNGRPWRCGEEAALALRKLIEVADRPILCEIRRRRDGVEVGVCRVGERDLGHAMVVSGNAVADDEAFPGYVDAEAEAKRAGVGLWRGTFVPPAEWRAGRRLAKEGKGPCMVKGVTAADGTAVYLVPTDPAFERAAAGSRCFDSDEAARAAGFERPRAADPPRR